MAARLAAIILALVSLPLWVLTASLASCTDFVVFDSGDVRLDAAELQRQAEAWADDQRSRLDCRLVGVRAQGGVAKAQYREPPPVVLGVMSMAATLSLAAAVVLGVEAWWWQPKTPADGPPETRRPVHNRLAVDGNDY